MKPGYLIDMDGVIYKGSVMIPGAVEFIKALRDNDLPFRFMTNNSQRTRLDIMTKLLRYGFDVNEEHIYTCAMSTARFLAKQKPGCSVYVIGEGGLLNALHKNGISVVDSDPDYVVVGEGRTLSFDMLEAASNMIHKGAKLISTNPDPSCPTAQGLRPGAGAITALLEATCGVTAFTVGKPSPLMIRDARKELNLSTAQTTIIGDTMETDILGGVQLGYRTILVLTGGTKREDLKNFAYEPDAIVESIADLCTPEYLGQS